MEIYKEIKSDILAMFLAVFVIITLTDLGYNFFKVGYDATDSYKNSERSGVNLRTDYGTGCQYLESSKGSLVPRLDKNGTHMCK